MGKPPEDFGLFSIGADQRCCALRGSARCHRSAGSPCPGDGEQHPPTPAVQGGKQSPGVLLEEADSCGRRQLAWGWFFGSRWQVSAPSKEWRCSAHVQTPACGEDRSSLAFAASQQGWHRSLRGPGQTPSSQPLGVRKSALGSCWAPLPNLHPGQNLKDLSLSSPGSTLPVSPQKEDPRPGKRCRMLCRGLCSPGCWQAAFLPFPACRPRGADDSRGAGPAKEGSGCVFEALAGRIMAQIASPSRLNFFFPGPQAGSSRWVRVQP